MAESSRAFLEGLFNTAVAAAHPSNCLPPHLPAPPRSGRLIVLAAGKAAGAMAEVAERHYLDGHGLPASRIAGLAVTRHGYAPPDPACARDRGRASGARCGRPGRRRSRRWRSPMPPGRTISSLVLMSGGASANWIAPAAGLSLAEKQALTRALLASGASIGEINARAQASLAHQGRPARRARSARRGW